MRHSYRWMERMRGILLRPHHLLCATFFVGEGYDETFVENMERIVSLLTTPGDLEIQLTLECDDICERCPHQADGRCVFGTSVGRKDRSAALFLGLEDDTALPAAALMQRVRERLVGLGGLEDVCGECEWMGICNARLAEVRGKEGQWRKGV